MATILPLSWAHCKKKSTHSWFNDNAIYECNKQEHPYQENIAYVSGIHYYENEVKTTKSTKLQKNLVTILMTITYFWIIFYIFLIKKTFKNQFDLTLEKTYTPISSKFIMKLKKVFVHVELCIFLELFVIVYKIVYKECE